ncbi:serine/arginine repetitive matrix protein 2-like [Hetaerina americana]|uniref:serine/arginine repetitive matrix protein 2-like n=1 Tax=Hetaerina americana TaxID=62018 RepID=UPI003A7F22CE
MEEANDADGPNSGRKAHKKKILIIEDSDDDSVIECESENSQLTPKRKTNPPPMEGIVAEGSSEGSDDSSDDLDTENSGESSDGVSNDSNSDQNSNWTTDSEEDVDDGDVEDDDDDITQPSTSRACTRRSRRLIDSLSDEPIASGDELTPQSPTQSGEVHSISEPPGGRALNKRMRVDAGSAPKEQDNFQGSSSETDDGEGHAKTRCPICLRSLPGPSGGAEVGSPEGCQHLFCVCCIQEWAKNVNTCPVDRHEFSEIVVYEGVGGKEIRRLPLPKKPRCAGDALDDEDITLISQIEEDPTFCEVCGSGDREDSLLLCDGCDRGYHLDCLTPPLTSVPIEEWFCSTCTSNDASRQRACRATRNMRLLPRTSASQRVLRSLRRDAIVEQGRRGLRTWNIDSHDLELMEEMAELEVERRWAANTTGRPSTSRGTSNRRRVTRRKVYRRKTTTRKKRKTVTKKRLVKRGDGGEEEEEEEVEEEEVTTTSRRRRGKRRKGAGKKSRRGKKFLSKKKGRSRLAETLGLVPGKKGILLRKKGMCGRGGTGGAQGVGGGADGGAVINGAASGIGGRVPTLSIFGSRNDLEYFSDGSDVEGGGGSLAVASIPRPVDSVHAHQLAKERLISGIGSAAERRKALIKERALASASPSSGAAGRGVPDILGSIMESQSVWHGRKSKVKINSDGSLVVEKSKTSNPTQDTGRGDTSAVGPKSIETTNINNEMNVNSGTARVPSNPAEPSTTAQDSCSTFRDGSSGVEVRDSAASVETREEIDASIRPLWPVRTLDANSREESSSANRKDRIPSQNVNETHYANRAPSTTATQSVVTTSSRATNNFRSIEHLAGNVIVNSNRNYLDSADDGCRGRLWESQPTSSVKNDRSVISSGFISHVNPMHEGDVLSGAGSFGVYGFSPNSPLDLSSSSHKGDARELLHRNMYLDLSSGGGGSAGFGPAGYGAPYAGVSCEAVDMRVQSLPNASATAEDLRVAPIPGNSHHHVRSLSVIKENPSVESTSRSLTGPLCQDVHADIGDLPLPPSERVGASVVTPLEAVKTIGLPGSSGNGSTSQAMNSSVRDMGGGERASGGGGGARGGANQRLDYARANSSYGSGTRDANGSANGGSEGGGGGGGDQNDRPQVLKRHLDEDEEEEDDKDREEDEDVDIYSDIEPGGSDPPTDNIPERHGMPSHAIETPPDQGPMFHPFLLRGGSDKYDPAEPSRDTDDEMVIDEEGGNEEESLTPWSEGEALPPPPLPPTILDYIVESPVNLHGYDSDRSVTPTEEDERRKAVAAEDSEGQGRPPVGVRVYGILSQGKFGLGVHNYGSDDEDEGEDEGCPNFSIYSATSVNIARTAEAEGEDSSKEIEDASGLSEKVDESLKITRKSLSPTEEIANSEKESGEDQWNADQSVTSEDPPSSQEKEDILVSEKVTEDSSSEKEAKKEPEKSSPEKSSPEKSSPEKSSPEKSSPGKSSPEKSDAEDDPSLSKSDVDAEKSDAEAEAEKSSDLENEKSDDGAKSILSKSLEESLPNEEENNLDDEGKELRSEEMEEAGESEPMGECERIRDIVVPELEGLETETISEAEEATAFEDLETSKRRSCGGEEEEGEIVDERARDKGMVGLDEKDVSEKDGDKDVVDQEIHKTDEGQKKEGKKEGKRRARKKADASKSGEATGSDAAIAWKKLSKLGKERNYREKGAEDPNQSKKELEDKEDKENRRGKKERDRRKGKRKDLERYDVRKVVGERSKTKRRRTDAFGRELRSNSKSRSRSRIFSRSRSRGARSRSRGGRSRSPRGRSRSHGAWSRSRGVRSRSRGRRSRSRGGRSRSRGPSKSRGRSRSRGKGRRSRSRSRARQRSRSKGGRSRSRGGRSRSRQRSRDRTARRGENAPSKATARKKSRRSHSPASERRKQSRSRSRQRKRSRSRRRRTEQSQGSWERSWTRSWSRSVTPIESRSLEKTRGHMRSRSMSGSRVLRDRSPMPMSRSPSCSRGRSFCRSPSTPTLPPPPRYRMGLQSISRSPSRSPERLRSPAVAAAVGASKKKRRKKEGKARKETDVGGKKRKKRRERSPAASKEVFASGDNILVSVSFKSAPKENSNMPKRRKASSPVEEKVKVMEEPAVDAGVKKKRKFMPVIKKKPSVIIDLETSPFVERVPSPADLIVLSDSSGENEDKGAKQLQQQQQQPMDSDIQRRHRMMILSPVPGQKTRGIGVKEKRVGAKLGKKGKLGKGKKGLGKKERKVAVAVSNAGIVPSEVVPLEEPQLPLSTPEEPPLERRLGPKTPPEPQVKFCIASKGSQLRSVNNPLREDDDEDEEDEIIASEAMAAAASQLELGQKVMVQGESEAIPQDVGIDGEIGESEAHQAVQVGPNTPPGPSTPILDGQFNEVDGGVSPIAPQEEAAVLSSSRPPGEDETSNKEGNASFDEPPSRKDQEMDTYDPFEPTNSPAPSPPAPETEPLGHQTAEESRDASSSAMAEGGVSQTTEEQHPVEEEAAVAEPKAEEATAEPTVEEMGPTPVQGSVQGVASIARTLGTTVGAIDAVGGLVLPLLAQLGAVAQPQPLNAAVAAVTSANSPIVQQQLSPLVNRAFPQQPQQAKAADVIRTLFGTGLRQFPEMVASSGAGGAFSVSQPKVSKSDLSLGGGGARGGKGGPRVAVTAPRVAVATPRVVVPTPRVAVTPRVATANGKDQAPGSAQDRVDVVDMDLESPYSPASSEGDDLFEPPSYESAGSARQTSVLGQQSQQSKKGSQRGGSAPSQDKFDNLFGSSPMRRNSGGGKGQSRNIKNHKGGGKTGKQRGKTGGKVNVRSEEDHHLTILDELPNSAVEMQVKEKFLIKLNRQERVVEEVKLALKPHYNKKHLSKDEYKDILRRSVPKICHNRSGEINPIKIRSLVEAYVRKFRYARKKDTAAAVGGNTRANKGKKPT